MDIGSMHNRQVTVVAYLICQCTDIYTLIHKPWALSTLLQAFQVCTCTVFLIIYSSKYVFSWHCQYVWYKDVHLLPPLSYRLRLETRSKSLYFHLFRCEVIPDFRRMNLYLFWRNICSESVTSYTLVFAISGFTIPFPLLVMIHLEKTYKVKNYQ